MAAKTEDESFCQGAARARVRLKVRPNEYVSLGDDTIIDASTLAININKGHIPFVIESMTKVQIYSIMTWPKRTASNAPVMMTKTFVHSCLLAMRYQDGQLVLLDGHKRVFSASISDPAHPGIFQVAIVEEGDCKPFCNKAEEIGDGLISTFRRRVFKIFSKLLKDNLPQTAAIAGERPSPTLNREKNSFINIIRGQALNRKKGGVVQGEAEKTLLRALMMSIEHCLLLRRAMLDPSKVSRAQSERLNQLRQHKAQLTGSIENDFDNLVEWALTLAENDDPPKTSRVRKHSKKLKLSWEHLDRNLRHQFSYVELGFNDREHMKANFCLLLSSKSENEKIDILILKYSQLIVYIRAIARIRSIQSMYNESPYVESGHVGIILFIHKFIRFFETKINTMATAIKPDEYIELGAVAANAGAIAYPEYQLLEGFQAIVGYTLHCATFRLHTIDEMQESLTTVGFYFIVGLLDMDNQDELWPHWKKVCELAGGLIEFGNLPPGFDEFKRGKLFFQILCDDDTKIIQRSQ